MKSTYNPSEYQPLMTIHHVMLPMNMLYNASQNLFHVRFMKITAAHNIDITLLGTTAPQGDVSSWTVENRLINLVFSLPVTEHESRFLAINHVMNYVGSKQWSKNTPSTRWKQKCSGWLHIDKLQTTHGLK